MNHPTLVGLTDAQQEALISTAEVAKMYVLVNGGAIHANKTQLFGEALHKRLPATRLSLLQSVRLARQ